MPLTFQWQDLHSQKWFPQPHIHVFPQLCIQHWATHDNQIKLNSNNLKWHMSKWDFQTLQGFRFKNSFSLLYIAIDSALVYMSKNWNSKCSSPEGRHDKIINYCEDVTSKTSVWTSGKFKKPGQGDLTEHRIQDTTRDRAVKGSEDSSNSVLLTETDSGRSEQWNNWYIRKADF